MSSKSTKFNGHYTRKCTANLKEDVVQQMTATILANRTTYLMVTHYVDRQQFEDIYDASCCIESIARLVLCHDDRESFRKKVRQSDHYMQLFDLAMKVRSVLKSSHRSTLENWMADYEED